MMTKNKKLKTMETIRKRKKDDDKDEDENDEQKDADKGEDTAEELDKAGKILMI